MSKPELFKIILLPYVISYVASLGFTAVMSIWVSPYWGWLVVPLLLGGPLSYTKLAARELVVL